MVRIWKNYLFPVLLILFSVIVHAQEGDIYREKLENIFGTFEVWGLMYNQVEYTTPQGFNLLHSENSEDLKFICSPNYKHYANIVYNKLIPNDNKVITFVKLPLEYSKDSIHVYMELIRMPDLKRPINTEHLKVIRSDFWINTGEYPSTLKDLPIAYKSHDYAQRAFNADTVIIYPLKVWEKYEGKYDRCQVTIIQKNGRGFIRLISLYNNKEDLDRCLKAMEGMFWYRNPDEYLKFTEPEEPDSIVIPINPNRKKTITG